MLGIDVFRSPLIVAISAAYQIIIVMKSEFMSYRLIL